MFHFLCDPHQYVSFSARSTAICFIFCAIHSNMFHFLCDPQQYFSFSARSTTIFFIFCAIHNNMFHFLCDPQQYFLFSARSTTIFFIFCAIHNNIFHFLCDPQHPGACSTLGTLWHLGGQGYTSEKHPGIHQKSQERLTPNFRYPWRRKKSQGYTKSRRND